MATAVSKNQSKHSRCEIRFAMILSLLLTLGALYPSSIRAQDTLNWIGSGQSEEYFHISTNWLQNDVPGPNDIAQFSISFAIPITINFENDQTVDELQMHDNDLTFRGFDFINSNDEKMFEMSKFEIDGDAKLTLTRGFNDQGFHLVADENTLHGEINVLEGTRFTADTVLLNAQETSDASYVLVSGEHDGTPTIFEATDLEMGNNSRATFTIENGAQAIISNATEISVFAGEGIFNVFGNNDSTFPSRLVSPVVISGPGSTTTISGRSVVETSRMGTLEELNAPTVIRVTTSDAIVDVDGLFTVSGGRVFVEDGGTLFTNRTTIGKSSAAEGFIQVQSQSGDLAHWQNAGNVFVGGVETAADNVGGDLFIDGGLLEIGGTLKLWDHAHMTISRSNNMPTHLVVDTIENNLGGNFEFVRGTLSVNWFEGDLENVAGVLAPGDHAMGNFQGRTVVAGDYIQGAGATLSMDIGGKEPVTEYDLMEVGGFMLADGRLELAIVDGFVPHNTDEIILVSAANIIGTFENVASGSRVSTVDGSGSFRVDYGFASQFFPNQVVLSDFEMATFLIGDVNGDGIVDLLDVAPFVEAITNGVFDASADINQDGAVDLLDVQPFVNLLVG